VREEILRGFLTLRGGEEGPAGERTDKGHCEVKQVSLALDSAETDHRPSPSNGSGQTGAQLRKAQKGEGAAEKRKRYYGGARINRDLWTFLRKVTVKKSLYSL